MDKQLTHGDDNKMPALSLTQLLTYDKIIVMTSGGKDSQVCLLNLLDLGVPKELIELWHQDVDGREGSDLMDWPITRDYVRAFAEAMGVTLYYQWLEGGIEREMLRDGTPKARTFWENPDGTIGTSGGHGKPGTRLKFPMVTGDLGKRWCSPYSKIDVANAAIAGQTRFNGQHILVITGERAQESVKREHYNEFEIHKTTNSRRKVDQWRPVHKWDETKVWETLERYKINVHPAYHLGWGRVSCMTCIFGSKHQWASIREIAPSKFQRIANYERAFKYTIQNKKSVTELAGAGTAYRMSQADKFTALASSYDQPIFLENWALPAGAFGESCGPT